MDRIVDGIRKFTEGYVDYLCHSQLDSGLYVNEYQCNSIDVVDYILNSIQSDSVSNPIQVDSIMNIQSDKGEGIIVRILIIDNYKPDKIPHGIIAFIKRSQVLVGQSIRGVTAFNLYHTNRKELDYRIDEAHSGNLTPLTGVNLHYVRPQIIIHYYKTRGQLRLCLPHISSKYHRILDRIRDEYIEYRQTQLCEEYHTITNPIVNGNLITELDAAISLRVRRQRRYLK